MLYLIKILLQTYFGDVRDIYEDLTSLAFDGLGLDFVEGKKSLELIKKGFAKDINSCAKGLRISDLLIVTL